MSSKSHFRSLSHELDDSVGAPLPSVGEDGSTAGPVVMDDKLGQEGKSKYILDPSTIERYNSGCAPVVGPARSEALIKGLEEVLSHHGAKKRILRALWDQVGNYLSGSTEKVWMKRSKDLLSYFLAVYLDNAPPASPDIRFQATGILKKWFNNRLKVYNHSNTHLWSSWNQAKRCSLPVSKEYVNLSYIDHEITLTSPDPGDRQLIDDMMRNRTFQKVLQTVRKAVAATHLEKWLETIPSTSACSTSSRKDGGQQNAVLEFAEQLNEQQLLDSVDFLQGGESLNSLESDESLYEQLFGEPYTPLEVKNPYVYNPDDDEEDEEESTNPHDQNDSVIFDPEFHSMKWYPYIKEEGGQSVRTTYQAHGYDEWRSLKQFERLPVPYPLNACIQGLSEPLKVRVISKGDAVPYYSMKLLQESMHGILRKMSCFRLIGRPFLEDDLLDLIKDLKDFEDLPIFRWFSIDYKGATDNLSSYLSSLILSEVTQDLPEFWGSMAKSVLGSHDLFYPEIEVEMGRMRQTGRIRKSKLGMQRGQLMGSILSFPILCLANLAVYLEVMKNIHRELGFSHSQKLNGVLINGDDMLYCAPEFLWAKHVDIGNRVGLTMSVGKAYVHATYCNINSVACHMGISPGSLPRRIDFLNVGLLFGRHKVQTEHVLGEDLIAQSTFIDCVDEITQGCFRNPHLVIRDYLRRFEKDIAQETYCCMIYKSSKRKLIYFNRNLFLPCSLGGMGCREIPGFRFKITRVQKKLASFCVGRAGEKGPITDFRPFPGVQLEQLLEIRKTPWCDLRTSSTSGTTFRFLRPVKGDWKRFRYGVFSLARNRHHH